MNVDIYDLSFNDLPKDIRLKHLKDTMVNPFDMVKNPRMVNPFTFKLFGEWSDGEHILHDPWSLTLHRKIVVENNKVIKGWSVNNENKFEKVEL